MRPLIEFALLSTVTLLAVATWLWKSLHGKSITLSIRRTVATQSAHRLHPRQDLAVGLVTPVQTVRRRSTLADLAGGDPGQNTHVPRMGERPDRAYFRQELGDVSDPDLRKAAAVGARRPGYVPESF